MSLHRIAMKTYMTPFVFACALILVSLHAQQNQATPSLGTAAATPPPSQLSDGASTVARQSPGASGEKLNILWTSGDKDVALKMVFMYAHAAKKQGWWKEIQLIVWGPSSKLTSEDRDVQDYLKRMQEAGVVIVACRACADQYGVSQKLESLGLEVKYMGQPLTEILKGGEKLLTF